MGKRSIGVLSSSRSKFDLEEGCHTFTTEQLGLVNTGRLCLVSSGRLYLVNTGRLCLVKYRPVNDIIPRDKKKTTTIEGGWMADNIALIISSMQALPLIFAQFSPPAREL